MFKSIVLNHIGDTLVWKPNENFPEPTDTTIIPLEQCQEKVNFIGFHKHFMDYTNNGESNASK